jgi:hypothetical protein
MVAERLNRKCKHRVDRATWLLLWSEHYAMKGFQREVVMALRSYFAAHPSPYERTFFVHWGSTEIYEVSAGRLGT